MRQRTHTASASSTAAHRLLLSGGSTRIHCVVEVLNEIKTGEFYEISSSNCYFGGIHWHGHGDSTGE
jgi:hypothetical protein